jgi:Peptide-N-glycosidase F, C terminal
MDSFSRYLIGWPRFPILLVLFFGLGAGCKSSTSGDDTPLGQLDAGADASIDGSVDTGADASPVDAGTDAAVEMLCDDGLPATPFDADADTVGYDIPAPDFTVKTTSGDWTLSEHWTGCDNYVFVMYHPGYTDSIDAFWESDISDLVDDSAPNTHYLFVTLEKGLGVEERMARVTQLRTRLDSYLASKDKATQDSFAKRLHYITDEGRSLPLVDGVLNVHYGEVHFTVDRKQLVREGHNTSYLTPFGWKMQLGNTRYWSKYINAQYLLDQRLEEQEKEEDVLVVRVSDHVDIAGSEPFTWTLPDRSVIATYDKLEIDLHVDCPGEGHPYQSTCGEWDTVGSIWLCADEQCTQDKRRRTVKWITPYSSPGRWLIDITPELVSLADGGELRFMAQHGDNDVGPYTYKYTVDLRFSKSADGLRPFAVEPLIPLSNYAFAEMADAFEPFIISAPKDTVKVELYARISGHGSESDTGCAEFCTFEHTFDVNGVEYQHVYLMENEDRCAQWVDLGVTPNQGGTWPFDRSSWCPGWTIEEWREDLTKSIVMDAENTIDHIPTYAGQDPTGGNMDARVELVYYK